ncbi:hypothetical protein [Aliiglaciecola sp. LCG003]|uniref:hypothetical protein n=1 Tax=Aliiglaciecola sp. LCG003 TaxID=3053655 RepID=UPI0025725705|nr:hypothetical protein [Aliiglaciecola sp. LCG003]WJG09953.1 hypothetical protein QR722_02650 [Aliiglaciecola sp. LCG003]
MLATIAGLVIGSIVNMSLIMVSGSIIPAPAGADITTTEGLQASIHLFEPKHFIFPFLAHSMGTFVGALVAALLTPSRTSGPAYTVGFLFLLGGIASVYMLPAPLWFSCLDLVAAYLPTAWLAHRLTLRQPGMTAE